LEVKPQIGGDAGGDRGTAGISFFAVSRVKIRGIKNASEGARIAAAGRCVMRCLCHGFFPFSYPFAGAVVSFVLRYAIYFWKCGWEEPAKGAGAV
jgi:hypothetical protein